MALEIYEGSYINTYQDTKLPEGWRVIMASGKKDTVLVAGVDTPDGEVWWTEAEVVGNVLCIDFSKKTNGKVGKLEAKPLESRGNAPVNEGTGLLFTDGSIWKRYAPKGSRTSDFAGTFSDPKHPEGWRMIAAVGFNETIVVGVDDPTRPGWWTKGTLVKDFNKAKLLVDFSKKTGGKVGLLTAETVEKGIKFPDGNVWSRIS